MVLVKNFNGRNLRNMRVAAHMSLRDFANLRSVSMSTAFAWEASMQQPTNAEMAQMCCIFNVAPSTLCQPIEISELFQEVSSVYSALDTDSKESLRTRLDAMRMNAKYGTPDRFNYLLYMQDVLAYCNYLRVCELESLRNATIA